MKLLVVAMAVVIAASAAAAQNNSPQPTLTGTQWRLVEMNTDGEAGGAPVENAITLDFISENTFGGSGGCNHYSGTYEASEGAIALDDIVSTLMACGEQLLNQREDAYFAALSTVTRYALDGGQLTFFSDSGQVLRFATRGATVLTGSSWRLFSILPRGRPGPALPAGGITLNFSTDSAAGFGGCNTYSGPYTLDADTLSIGAVVSTRMACAEDEGTLREADYFAALGADFSYRMSGKLLTLWKEDHTVLRFAADGAYGLNDSEWALIDYGVPGVLTPVIGEALLTLEFVNSGEVAGYGGCNTWSSTYETMDDELIAIAPGVSTLMSCMDNDLNQQEAVYFGLLNEAAAFELNGSQLTIFTASEQVLRFTAAGPIALYGTGWELARIMRGDTNTYTPIEGYPIWLRLEPNGTFDGSSACNSYSGEYAVGGDGLAFLKTSMTMMSCADNAVHSLESRYMKVLSDVTRFEVVDGTLVLYMPIFRLEYEPAGP